MKTLSFETALASPADVVWAHVTTMDGVNEELGPWLRMSSPASARGLDLRAAPVGARLFRSYLLLFGVLPIDWDDLAFAAIGERSFAERSTMMSMRRWEHDRGVEEDGAGCRVRDVLRFEPRVPGTGGLLGRVVRATFRHRHAQLARRFGVLT